MLRKRPLYRHGRLKVEDQRCCGPALLAPVTSLPGHLLCRKRLCDDIWQHRFLSTVGGKKFATSARCLLRTLGATTALYWSLSFTSLCLSLVLSNLRSSMLPALLSSMLTRAVRRRGSADPGDTARRPLTEKFSMSGCNDTTCQH